MGSNLSKFRFGTEVKQLLENTECLTPPHPPHLPANKVIIYRPVVELDSDDEYEPYDFPVFLSSPYLPEKIVTISDSEWASATAASRSSLSNRSTIFATKMNKFSHFNFLQEQIYLGHLEKVAITLSDNLAQGPEHAAKALRNQVRDLRTKQAKWQKK